MKIKIELLSDLCTTSGDTHNSMVDSDVTYDSYGLPYIPAKRLKGCIREAALEMADMGFITQKQYQRLFGAQGNASAGFSVSNALICDYDKVVEDLRMLQVYEMASPQNVLDQYTYTRTQTAVDLETGVAQTNSLRTIRVVRRGLRLEAACDVNCEEDKEVLKKAVSLVKHIGVARTRGLGLVNMELSDEKTDFRNHVQIEKSDLGEYNKIGYRVHLNSAVICKAPSGNQAVTQDYIAGSKILGLIAGAMGEQAYKKMMDAHDVKVSNAYIEGIAGRSIPGRISLQKRKDQSGDSDGKLWLKDMICEPDVEGIQMTPAGISYIDAKRNICEVETEISYHHQRPEDKSIGRATGKEDGSSFYQLAAICKDQTFCGYLYADRESAEQIIDAVSALKKVRMGYGRTSEFGDVEFTLDAVEVLQKDSNMVKDLVITFLADTILYNESGMPVTQIETLKNYLEDILGVSDLAITKPYMQYTMVGGFNVTWGKRKPVFPAIGKGSVVCVHSEQGMDAGLLKDQFIGERVAEGYGEVLAEEPVWTADYYVKQRTEEQRRGNMEKLGQSVIAEKLLQAEFSRKLEQAVRYRLRTAVTHKEVQLKQQTLNPVISKMRVMFKNEKNYEGMKEQAAGIEEDTKRKLCEKLLELVDPCMIKQQVYQEITELYQIPFETGLSEEQLYRSVYRTYITELKYLVKSLEKRGNAK